MSSNQEQSSMGAEEFGRTLFTTHPPTLPKEAHAATRTILNIALVFLELIISDDGSHDGAIHSLPTLHHAIETAGRSLSDLDERYQRIVNTRAMEIMGSAAALCLPENLRCRPSTGARPRSSRKLIKDRLSYLKYYFEFGSNVREKGSIHEKLMVAFNLLEGGELPELFRPSSRVGKDVAAYTTARLRFEIFVLMREVKRRKVDSKKLKKLCAALLVDYDTIKRWESKNRSRIDPRDLQIIQMRVATLIDESASKRLPAIKRRIVELTKYFNEARIRTS